jgi:RNA polymerase sigma-32 factor
MSSSKIPQIQDSLDLYMAEVSRHPLLSRPQELQLARRLVDEGDVRAAHGLVVANLRFVVKIAHEYRGYGLKLLDLIQEGNIGLMMAVKKFDPDKGYRLISYAVWWIRAHIKSYIMRSWSLVRMGAGRIQRKLFFKLRSERNRAEQDGAGDGEPIDAPAMASRLGVHVDDITEMDLRLACRDYSLDAQLGDTPSAASHLDMLPSSEPNQEDMLGDAQEKRQVQQHVAAAMRTLNDKERYIVEQRLLRDEPQTLQQIGNTFKVSRERVRQLETRVLQKLRKLMAPTAGGLAGLPAAAAAS